MERTWVEAEETIDWTLAEEVPVGCCVEEGDHRLDVWEVTHAG